MSRMWEGFDEAFLGEAQGVYRLCFLLARRRKAALRLAFEAFLRLGAAKPERVADATRARALLYGAAVRACDDYYLRRPHRKPTLEQLEQMDLPFAVTHALYGVLNRPFSHRAMIGLLSAGFSRDQAQTLLKRARRLPSRAFSADAAQLDAVSRVCMTQEDSLALSDGIYERFAERSVGVENALHAVRSAFDRAAPLLLLAAAAICALAWRLTA